MVTRCYFCGGKTAPKRVTAENWWGENLFLVEDVPAMVCEDCGESYFDADTSLKLDRLREAPPEPWKTLQVPVYAFSEGES